MNVAQGVQAQTDSLSLRLLFMNFSSIHTTSIVYIPFSLSQTLIVKTLTHAFYNLAAYPEYISPLRDEIEEIVGKEGWTYTSVLKMRKLDSFLMESIRLHPLGQRTYPSSSIIGVI